MIAENADPSAYCVVPCPPSAFGRRASASKRRWRRACSVAAGLLASFLIWPATVRAQAVGDPEATVSAACDSGNNTQAPACLAACRQLQAAGQLDMDGLSMAMFHTCKMLIASPGQGGADNPADTVSAVVRLDKGSTWAPLFDVRPTTLMRRYFTAAFNAAWANAMTHNKDEPVLDGDPVSGGQSVDRLTLVSTTTHRISDEVATVVGQLQMIVEGKPEKQSVTFTMKREGGAWRIDDMTGPIDGTIRTYFRTSYGK